MRNQIFYRVSIIPALAMIFFIDVERVWSGNGTFRHFFTVTFDNKLLDERILNPMRERNQYRENLKYLLDKWNTDFDKLKEVQKDSEGALKNIKQGLENSWTAFEKGFE